MGYDTEGFRPLRQQLRMEGGVDAPTVSTTLTGKSGNFQAVNPAAGTALILLGLEATSEGLITWVGNVGTGGGVVEVRSSTGAVLFATLLDGASVVMACDGTTWHPVVRGRAFPGIDVRVLAGNLVLPADANEYQQIDPGANRTITLPAAAANKGRSYHFSNFADAAENIDVGGIVTINQNEAVRVVSDGAAWQHTGVVTIALA